MRRIKNWCPLTALPLPQAWHKHQGMETSAKLKQVTFEFGKKKKKNVQSKCNRTLTFRQLLRMGQSTYSQVHKYWDTGEILIFLDLQHREPEKGAHVKMRVFKGVSIQIR